jgi:hypothetical protein
MFVGLTACLVMATLWVESRAEDLVRVGKGGTRPAAQERSENAGNPLVGSPYLQLLGHREGNSARIDAVWHAAPDSSRWSVQYKEEAESSWRKVEILSLGWWTSREFPLIVSTTARFLILNRWAFDYRLLRNSVPIFSSML